jgi:2,4-dienoyl-CoA reductase-like NADH-dependent reductase (Old Yellow Enzyme family)
VLLSFRINAYAGIVDRAIELDDAIVLAKKLSHCGVHLIDLSAGLYTLDRNLIYPCGKDDISLPYYEAAVAVAQKVASVVAFAGNVRDVRSVPTRLPANVMVSAARAFIADPQFAVKSALGKFDEIISCARCNQCHYFSRGKFHIECGINLNLVKN